MNCSMKETATMTHPHPPSGIIDGSDEDPLALIVLLSFDAFSPLLSNSFIFENVSIFLI